MEYFWTILIVVYIIKSCTCTSVNLPLPRNSSTYDSTINEYGMTLCALAINECNEKEKYRSISGSCNNLQTRWFGAYKTPHLRILDAYYEDDTEEYKFRKQKNGNPLHNPRDIQIQLFLNRQFPYWNKFNVIFMQWGQFIAHDTSALLPNLSAGSDCCKLQNENPVPIMCREVIEVPKNDPVYSLYGQTCINFVRAQTSDYDKCSVKSAAVYMVQVTHFIDGSPIYGSSEDVAASLRLFKNGRLKSDDYDGQTQEFCPQQNRKSWECGSSEYSKLCYMAGDGRVNQNLGIALFQNMFLRFHNVIANRLYSMNPFWLDEKIYQETRRIVIAVIQHITYTYYLPILLGEDFVAANGFHDQTKYDEKINPSTALEYSAGAFRIPHNQIPSVFNLIGENYTDSRSVLLTDWMDKPDLLPDNFDYLLRGILETPTRIEQPSYNPMISNYLFQETSQRQNYKFRSLDLLTMDIQRGRDTGIPPYNEMRTFCGINKANDFDELIDLIPYEDIQALKELYSSVDDIDFIVGALLEVPAEGAKVGLTTRCIIADSFYRYKFGDRFFYDVQGENGSFKSEQLKILKTVNFGHIICATSYLQYLPGNTFMPLYSRNNTRKYNCNSFQLNLNAWKD